MEGEAKQGGKKGGEGGRRRCRDTKLHTARKLTAISFRLKKAHTHNDAGKLQHCGFTDVTGRESPATRENACFLMLSDLQYNFHIVCHAKRVCVQLKSLRTLLLHI